MNWHLQVPIPKYSFDLTHSDKVISVGSCFAQHMAEQLLYYKYSCSSNLYGTLFHPIPLLNNLTNALKNVVIDDGLFLENGELVFHYSYHSSIFGASKNELKNKLQKLQESVLKDLKESTLLILTFGTSFLYQLAESEKAVANCHKQSKNSFTKTLTKPSEITTAFESFYKELKAQNPNIQILLTVSPVRHIRDGIHENNLSKATLLLACEALQKLNKDVHYFPSYEIVIDELRDYRFYEKDRVHPNQEARDYVWAKFSTALINVNSLRVHKDLDKLFASINHRAFREESTAHQSFLKNTLETALLLNNKVNLHEEIKLLKNRIQ
tara:strand:- start:540 stop:1514 length:975 start_codon:yes stop_codon:yes gene_type:complete